MTNQKRRLATQTETVYVGSQVRIKYLMRSAEVEMYGDSGWERINHRPLSDSEAQSLANYWAFTR